MRFEVTQVVEAEPEAVAAAFVDPDWYLALAELPKLGAPDVLLIEEEGDLVLSEVRYRFTGDLNPAVRAAVDPDRLTWVERAQHDLEALRSTFVLLPDHYAARFSCRGETHVTGDGGRTERVVSGELKVRMPLVGGQVERAILSGLREHLEAEAELLASWLGA